MGAFISSMLSNISGEGFYTVLGDTDGFFSSYLQQPSDTKATLFKKSTDMLLDSFNSKIPQIAIFPPRFGRKLSEASSKLSFEESESRHLLNGGSIRSSLRDGLNTPKKIEKGRSLGVLHHVLIHIGDLQLVLSALNLSTS